MSDDSLEIIKDSPSLSEQSNDIDDYEERVEQLKRISQNDEQGFQIHYEVIPEDLQLLQLKIQQKELKKLQAKPKKKNFVPVNNIRTAIIIHLYKLYRQHQFLKNNIMIGLNLSFFKFAQLDDLEQKLKENLTFQGKLKEIFITYSLTYSVKTQFTNIKKENALEPAIYILQLAQFYQYYGIKTRIIRAFDLGFLGLEQKFHIKTIKKDNKEKIQEELIEQSTTNVLEKNPFYHNNNDEQIESLDNFIFKQPQKKNKVNSKQQQKQQNSQLLNMQLNKQESLKNNDQLSQQQKISKIIGKKPIKEKSVNTEICNHNQCLWLECFNEDQNEWVTFDPIDDRSVSLTKETIKQKLHHSFSHYILGIQDLTFKNANINSERIFGNSFFIDLTEKYAISFHIQRVQLGVAKWFNYLAFKEKLYYKSLEKLVNEPISADNHPPSPNSITSEKEFKYSKFYAIPSQLSQYQIIHPDAKALEFFFKEEPIYNYNDVVLLHSKDRWREFLRDVPKDTPPIKEVSQRFDKTKTVALYAFWQTQDLKVSLQENNGNLPSNQYGNYETFAFPPPKGTKLYRISGIKNLLQKNNIQFIEAVEGFDSSGTKMFAQKCGYLLYEKDYDKTVELVKEYKLQQEEKYQINKRKELMKQWKDLFKSILLKRDLQTKYQLIQ